VRRRAAALLLLARRLLFTGVRRAAEGRAQDPNHDVEQNGQPT
jgi:hypothetical protein